MILRAPQVDWQSSASHSATAYAKPIAQPLSTSTISMPYAYARTHAMSACTCMADSQCHANKQCGCDQAVLVHWSSLVSGMAVAVRQTVHALGQSITTESPHSSQSLPHSSVCACAPLTRIHPSPSHRHCVSRPPSPRPPLIMTPAQPTPACLRRPICPALP